MPAQDILIKKVKGYAQLVLKIGVVRQASYFIKVLFKSSRYSVETQNKYDADHILH